MPNDKDFELLNKIEDYIFDHVKPEEGDLYIGRETADNIREIYFASKDFRTLSQFLSQIISDNASFKISFERYKDKYWRSFERYGIN